VWSFDSCGVREDKLDECEARLCHEDTCDPPPTEPCEAPPEGTCVGDVVRLCHGERLREIDCRPQGKRCIMGEEGAHCAARVDPADRCGSEPTRCDGDLLVHCEEGRTVRTDCRTQRAHCLTLAGEQAPRCVAVLPLDPQKRCGPCGCPPDPTRREHQCDGRDEDGDGLLDEGLDCGPVPVLAILVTDASGRASHARADIEEEIARVNQLLTRAGGGDEADDDPRSASAPLTFVLADVLALSDDRLRALDEQELSKLSDDPRVHPARDAFYVPLIFTDTITAEGGVPRSGLATLPNGTCGGLQRGHGPEVGVIAVAKERAPTTVAHELGHFLGLCHTHGVQESVLRLAVASEASSAPEACLSSCRGEGDGICDTPLDPGPLQCRYDAACRTACTRGDTPDPTNLMSYYTSCRTRFTPEQVERMQHTLALRRGWHRCTGGSCLCQLGGRECPAGMSCHPFVLPSGDPVARCALDGPRPLRADCESTAECGSGAICVTTRRPAGSRCMRPCVLTTPDCTCVEAGPHLRLCAEDVGLGG